MQRRGTGRNPRSEEGLIHLLGRRKSPEVAQIVCHDVDLGVKDLLVPKDWVPPAPPDLAQSSKTSYQAWNESPFFNH
jgi:hypothetical protein